MYQRRQGGTLPWNGTGGESQGLPSGHHQTPGPGGLAGGQLGQEVHQAGAGQLRGGQTRRGDQGAEVQVGGSSARTETNTLLTSPRHKSGAT